MGIILIGLPIAIIISLVISYAMYNKRRDKQQILQYVFAKKCKNSGRCISGITGYLKLVNELSESELTDGCVWKQSKLFR